MPMPEREQEQEPLRQQKIVDFMLGDSGVLAEQRLLDGLDAAGAGTLGGHLAVERFENFCCAGGRLPL